MIYTTGTIAGNGSTITGTGTNFTAAGSLIRVGCTLIAFTNPVQVLQLTAITSGNALSVTPAISPAIAAGTKFAILLSDSLSVDGLAQDIAETFGMYQRYMSGFADVMNGAGNVTITINGAQVTVPGQKSLAKKGANSDITSLSGLTTPLSMKQGGVGANNPAGARDNLQLGATNTPTFAALGLGTDGTNTAAYPALLLTSSSKAVGGVGREIRLENSAGEGLSIVFRDGSGQNTGQRAFTLWSGGMPVAGYYVFYGNHNTTKAADGTLKAASPVVKIFADGRAENNGESEGVTVTRQGVGEYLVEGCMGLNADAAWGGIDGGFDIPTDRNKQPLIWLDYEVNEDGSVLVKTYHRTYPDAPVFARNEREGFAGGDPIDIPADQFISVRVEMPQNSIWNLKILADQKAAEEADRIEAQRVVEAKRIAAEKVQDEGEQSQP
ncbi:phage tail protein [Buttiauxella sp. A2-C1_F]|uniref:phage tail fiber protein n=1 Tax=Buttiauxella sp. A2-C1_F TaxID=2904526 RepID=UPI001E3953C8|nr:phage tail protein [Buttiauxella sp. A2-C1_F]MCE0845978.1 phage tail protein [Buttiauxella sp. A2-C1_F]